ncbi:MAG: hypothetical protein P4L98_20465 [Ancalomicrobiaceae bacterium]|nr:hypothetical protein [Ancalomicrobiaceae bacterium]
MKMIVFLVGVAATLLGLLWLLQGTGIVHVQPILCFADCEPIQGPSIMWAAIGAVMILAGALGVFYSRRLAGRNRHPDNSN